MNNTDNQISCLVDFGTVFAKRDMVRILRDLDHVTYTDLIDNVVISQGEGYVIEVYSNSYDSTLIFNNRLHINVNGFEYLNLQSCPTKEISLVSGHRTVKLRPLNNSSSINPSHIEEEIDEQRLATISQFACDNEVDLNYFED